VRLLLWQWSFDVRNGAGIYQDLGRIVEGGTLHEAERLIESCEHCNPDGAEIPFDNVLDRVTRSDLSVTYYILERAVKCPNCRCEILERHLSSFHNR